MQFKSLLTSALFFTLIAPVAFAGRGRVSFYEDRPTKSSPGSCGSNYIYDYYIALNKEQYQESLCGKCVKIVYNNKYLVGRLIDRCPGCGYGGLDISPSMFEHFENKKEGIFTADWEYVSCDNYGKKGTCSGSNCGMSSSSNSKATTTTSKKTTTTTAAATSKPVTSSAPKPITTNVNASSTGKTIPTTPSNVNQQPNNASPAAANSTANATTVTINQKATETPNSTVTNNNNNGNVSGNGNGNDNKNKKVEIAGVSEETNDDSSTSYVLPLTGALMVSGAAGVGLVYFSRNKQENIQGLKQKFPEAFKNIKRSLTKGSSIRRKVTRTYTKKRSQFEDDNDANNNSTTTTSNPNEMDISETRININ